MVDAASKRGFGCFLLIKDGGGSLEWRRVAVPEGELVNVDRMFERDRAAIVFYSSREGTYYSRTDVSARDFLQAVLTAPWSFRDIGNVRLTVAVRNPATGAYEDVPVVADRYDLAGRWGQLLRDVGDAACKSGIIIALIDAVVWLRGVWSNSSAASVSPRYAVVGLLLGVLLYALGLLLKYLFDRFYGRTPAARIGEACV
jgi:hypothetical protein